MSHPYIIAAIGIRLPVSSLQDRGCYRKYSTALMPLF
jgi:hypothetical protein